MGMLVAVRFLAGAFGVAVITCGSGSIADMISLVMCIQTYLADAFTIHAASATAANAVLRSLLGALLPLCGLDMYNSLGLGWGNSLLAFIALGLRRCLGSSGFMVSAYGRIQNGRSNSRYIC